MGWDDDDGYYLDTAPLGEVIMPFVIGICGLLVIAAVIILSWRWMEIQAQIRIEGARATRPIHERVDGLDARITQIEGYITGDDVANQHAIDWAVSKMPPELQKKWKEGQPRES